MRSHRGARSLFSLGSLQTPVSQFSNSHRQLIYSTLAVLGLALVAKFSGAFKEVVLANSLGTSALVDQFVFAFNVATWPAALLTSVLTIALTPVLAKLADRAQDSAQQKRQFISQLWGACIGLGLLVGVTLWLCFPYLSPVARAGGPKLAALVGLVSFLACMTALATVVVMAHGRQIGTLLEGVPSLTLGVFLLASLWQPADTLGYGLLLGMVLQLLLMLAVHTRYAVPVRVALPATSRRWDQLFSGLGYASAGYALLAAAGMFEMYVASQFAEGSVASLGYAARITALVTGLLATAVNRVAIVHFCDAGQQRSGDKRHWRNWLGVLTAFTLTATLASVVLMIFAPEIIAFIFERGRFDAQATDAVTRLMRWHISQLGPYLATVVLGAYLSATGGFKSLFFGCALCFCSEVLLVLVTANTWGMDAVAAAPMVGRMVMFGYLLVAVLRQGAPGKARNIVTTAASPL
jgi:putative peptidoglycan lipid II flippase